MKILTDNFEYALKSANRPKPEPVILLNQSRPKFYLATNVLGDSYGSPAVTNAKWGK